MPEIEIPGILTFTRDRFTDHRGYLSETFSVGEWAGPHFVQDNESFSLKAGSVRGLHFQTPPFAQAKLIRCVTGAVYDVAVDLRQGSPTFGRHSGVELSAANGRQRFLPAGLAHGFVTLTPDTLVQYKVSAPHAPEHSSGIAWDDPALEIDWPLTGPPTLSARDQSHPRLADLPPVFRFTN